MINLRCIHRHTIDEHPACFVKGLVKGEAKREEQPWYVRDGFKIGYLDIETDGLRADFSTMLTWCVKEKGGKVHHDAITKEELFNGKTDQRITQSLIDKMREFKIIVTYYGTGFDLPFVRTKALRYNMDFPAYDIYTEYTKSGKEIIRIKPELIHWDIYYTVKSKMNLSRKSLDNACDYLGIKGKTPIDKDVWRLAKYGDKSALKEVLVHNKADVEILEQLHDKLVKFAKWERKGM